MKHSVPDGLSVVGSCVGQSSGSLFGTNIANASCTCSSVDGHSSMLWSFESPAKTQSLATCCYYDDDAPAAVTRDEYRSEGEYELRPIRQ